MIIDKLLEFCDGTAAHTLGTGVTLVGDVVDLGVPADIGVNAPMYLVLQVGTAADGGATDTGVTQFILASDAQAAIAVDGTETRHLATDSFAAAQLTAGKTLVYPLPSGDSAGGKGYERYLGVLVNQTGEEEDALTINAFLVKDASVWQAYADAQN